MEENINTCPLYSAGHSLPSGESKRCSPLTNEKLDLPTTLVLPVSGHGMVEQMGMLFQLAGRGYIPKVCLGASGGALSAAVGISFQWNIPEIQKWIQRYPCSELFKHRPLSYLEAGSKCSLFEIGADLEQLFQLITRKESEECFRRNELIVSTKNKTTGQMEIFSTVTAEESILRDADGPLTFFGVSCKIRFLGSLPSNIYRDRLGKVLRATSAVPTIFPPVEIEGNFYVDGGVSFSSPLNPITGVITLDDVLYILPEDIEQPNPTLVGNVFDEGQAYLSDVSRSNYIHDRAIYMQGITCGKLRNAGKITGDAGSLAKSLKSTQKKKRFVELFPCKQRSLPIMSSHSRKDIMTRIAEQQGFLYRIHYI